MNIYSELNSREDKIVALQEVVDGRESIGAGESAVSEGEYIDVEIFGNKYHLKILRICHTLEIEKIVEYISGTKCAFVRAHGSTVLAIDIRDNAANSSKEKVMIVVAEVKRNERNGIRMPLGFIVESIEGFYKKIS